MSISKQSDFFPWGAVKNARSKETFQKRNLASMNLNQSLKLNNLKSILKESKPEWMVLSLLPVLPPDLRPIIQLSNGICSSDLNRLYQKVIYRNERLKRFLKDGTSTNSPQMKFAYRLLQEAVDNLIDNGKGKGAAEIDNRGLPLKSLTELLKGKRGRFRQNLLGKRVDYSGRSVIVVGPKLRLHECGLPKEMALELFMPFVIQKILGSGKASTILGAKKLLRNNVDITWEFLNNVMRENPVLLNRAPTLHRLGFQAFQPKLVEGKAILLHPLVCPAFNADFDGDQMAVHVPITAEAKLEAWKLMLARNHLLSAATGDVLLLPSQDMVLGCYYLTAKNPKLYQKKSISVSNKLVFNTKQFSLKIQLKTLVFTTVDEVLIAMHHQKISLHSIIWFKWNKKFETHERSHNLLELRINSKGQVGQIFNFYYYQRDSKEHKIDTFIQTTPGRIMFHNFMFRNTSI
jgi:DNA-directed RNA polymerase subunit beta'